MINLLIGGPGGGKSYEAVAYHVLPALQRGRLVITNLPLNIPQLEAIHPGCTQFIEIREKTLCPTPSFENDFRGVVGGQFSTRAFSNAEDFASTWRDPSGNGPLYVVDECHFVMPRMGTSRAVEEWFSMHRHFNCDVLLITQSSGKISPAIRDLVQVCYKVRKATALGRSNGYIRKVLDGVNGGEVSVTERKYQPQFFKLYRSHTQGLALAENDADDVAPFTVKFRRMSWVFYAFTAVVLVWAFWPVGESTPAPPGAAALISRAQAHESAVKAGRVSPEVAIRAAESVASAPALPASAADVLDVGSPEPFAGNKIHLSGWARMGGRLIHTFVISGNGQRLFELQEREISSAGYSFKPLGECSGLLTFRDKVRAVICDSPTAASGRNNAPLVMAVNGRGESVTSHD